MCWHCNRYQFKEWPPTSIYTFWNIQKFIYNATTNLTDLYELGKISTLPSLVNFAMKNIHCHVYVLFKGYMSTYFLPKPLLSHHWNTNARQVEIVHRSCSVYKTLHSRQKLHFPLEFCSCPSFVRCSSMYSWLHVHCISGSGLGFHSVSPQNKPVEKKSHKIMTSPSTNPQRMTIVLLETIILHIKNNQGLWTLLNTTTF